MSSFSSDSLMAMKTGKTIVAVITDVLGERVVILSEALNHVIQRHFPLIPNEIVLEVIERVLKDPTEIFEEKKTHLFHLFYRFDSRHYIVVIVKQTQNGSFFVTAYPTGNTYRRKHKKLRKVQREKP